MKNVKQHIHNQINYLVKYRTPALGGFGNLDTMYRIHVKLNSEVRNQITNAQPPLIKETILK
jgi:hypothetical protein